MLRAANVSEAGKTFIQQSDIRSTKQILAYLAKNFSPFLSIKKSPAFPCLLQNHRQNLRIFNTLDLQQQKLLFCRLVFVSYGPLTISRHKALKSRRGTFIQYKFLLLHTLFHQVNSITSTFYTVKGEYEKCKITTSSIHDSVQ